MRLIPRTVIAVALLSSVSALAQTPAQSVAPASPAPASTTKMPAEVSLQFDRTGLPVPRFTLHLWEDGTGRYVADQAELPATANSSRGQAAQHIDRPIKLTPTTIGKVFKAARSLNHFNIECASKAKNIADTGKKTLTYTGDDGSGSCLYNYSENKSVETLTDQLQAIAFTLDEGRRLEFLHRYDRLGLDAEMISLAQEAEAGRALELGTISPTLLSIADDTALIQRVRLKAQKMLEQINQDNH